MSLYQYSFLLKISKRRIQTSDSFKYSHRFNLSIWSSRSLEDPVLSIYERKQVKAFQSLMQLGTTLKYRPTSIAAISSVSSNQCQMTTNINLLILRVEMLDEPEFGNR